jgi:hypothetical protein
MNTVKVLQPVIMIIVAISLTLSVDGAMCQVQQSSKRKAVTTIPKTWDDNALRTLEIPLANPIGSPEAVSADYYYKIPVRPIYKQYPIYAPGREPAGYMEHLKQLDPVILWDGVNRGPRLDTERDYVNAGETVFSAPVFITGEEGGVFTMTDIRNRAWWGQSKMPLTPEGVMPFMTYVIREKGKVELGSFACTMCHTRIMPDGKVVNGAQGNMPFGAAFAQSSSLPPPVYLSLYSVPWQHPDPAGRLTEMADSQLREVWKTIPPGSTLGIGLTFYILYKFQT